MNIKSIIRNIIILAIMAGLGYGGYRLFFADKAPAAPASGLQTTAGLGAGTSATPNLATTSTTSDSAIGSDFLDTLLSVKSISLDESIFTNKAFTILQDFNRPIPPDTDPGRVNPFAPIGADGVAASSVMVSTSNPSSITATSAALNGTLIVGDPAATRWFEYGPTSAFGSMTPAKGQGVPGAFTETVDKLLPNTTYYVRAGASVGGTIVNGNTLTWKTASLSR